jgi:hypothetical protein
MNKKLMFIGFGATLAFILCFGSGQSSAPQPSESGGRYRMFSTQPSTGLPETYVIDTQSGRVWRQTFYTDVKGIYLVPQTYVTADGISASAVPSDTVSLESLSLQKKYDMELEKAREKTSESK